MDLYVFRSRVVIELLILTNAERISKIKKAMLFTDVCPFCCLPTLAKRTVNS